MTLVLGISSALAKELPQGYTKPSISQIDITNQQSWNPENGNQMDKAGNL